jgi:integrase
LGWTTADGDTMARGIERLSDRAIRSAKDRGMIADGRGLWLRIGPTGSKSWIFRYADQGRRHELGLGPYPVVSLAMARDRAMQLRRQRIDGTDPLQARRAAALECVAQLTFKEATERYLTAHAPGWRGTKNLAQWEHSLGAYAYPILAGAPVASIDVGLVLRVLEPIWTVKPETASRVRGRIEAILDWATARGLRRGENPARWRGHLENLLAPRKKVARVEHHAALPYSEIAGFTAELRQREGAAAQALEFAILTAGRRAEVLGMTWAEVDVANRIWTIPGERMKSGKVHRVPLSDAAIAVLEGLPRNGDRVFGPAATPKTIYKEAARVGVSVHGFRSTFSQWAAERTSYPFEVRELALAHTVGSQVERSYQRSDLFDRRRRLMGDWAKFCGTPATCAEVVPIRA